MREIKFRSYDTVEQSYCPFITDHLNRELYPHIEVQQYTGLLSKDGVEIYEGDIVGCLSWSSNHKNEDMPVYNVKRVMFKHACFIASETDEALYDKMDDPSMTKGLLLISSAFHKFDTACEIIGNIHENPELLKENT